LAARRNLRFVLRLLARVSLLGPRLDRRPRLGHLAQTLLAQRQFVGYRHAVGNVGHIRSLRLGHQIGDLGLQLRLDLARMLVGKRAVAARVGVDLRAVQPNRAHLQQAHLAGELKNNDEQLLDILQEAPAKRCDRVVVGMIVRRDEPKRHRVVGRPLQLAAGEHPRRIAVNQQAQQHPGMIRSRTRAAISPAHPAKVQPLDHFDDEPRQMSLRQPLVHRRRKQITRLPIVHPEIAHAPQATAKENQRPRFYSANRRQSRSNRRRTIKSDRLLVDQHNRNSDAEAFGKSRHGFAGDNRRVSAAKLSRSLQCANKRVRHCLQRQQMTSGAVALW